MSERLRLVLMGDSNVGKSSLCKRFLFGSFDIKYTPTIEDLFSRDYELDGMTLKVDILDTAGDAQFPVMRRLSIASAHAFILMYSVAEPSSFSGVMRRYEEIKELRKDIEVLPIVIVANKCDLNREIDTKSVLDWFSNNLNTNSSQFLDVSVLESFNVNEVFKSFLNLCKISFGSPGHSFRVRESSKGLRRHRSANGRIKMESSSFSEFNETTNSTSTTNIFGFLSRSSKKSNSEETNGSTKCRTRSLIRRYSKKNSKNSSKNEDCSLQ